MTIPIFPEENKKRIKIILSSTRFFSYKFLLNLDHFDFEEDVLSQKISSL